MQSDSTKCPTPPSPLAEVPGGGWALDPNIIYLNHGCFGARTHAVCEAQHVWTQRFESNPIEWLDRRRGDLMAEARDSLARFLGTTSETVGFVTNATNGVNAVIRSLRFSARDELITISHVYNAVRLTMSHLAGEQQATYREIDLPVPLDGPEQVLDVLEAAIGPKTRLIVVDHVTSPTAFILPIHAIVDRAREKGIDVLVDGAHAPGMLDLNLDDLNAAYYVGNLHKWVGAPRGAAFLRVSPDRQQGIHPTTISHFLDQGFTQEFDWQGTRDISPWLCTSTAIDVMAEVGWDRIRQHNHALAVWVGDLLCRRWDVAPISPPDGSMIGSMVTVPLPDGFDQWAVPEALSAYLSATHSFEVPIVDWAGRRWLRASCQIYNRPQEYEHLADVMLSLAHRDPVTDAVIASQPLD